MARKWGTRFRPVKCKIMQITRERTNKIEAAYTLEGRVLENAYSIKYLEVTITNDLRWNTHISNMCTKENGTLGFLRQNLYPQAPFWNMTAVFGIPNAWFFNKKSKKKKKKKKKKNQNRAAKFVTSNYCFKTGSMTVVLESLKWASLKKRRRDSRLIFCTKVQYSNRLSYSPS